MKLILSEKTFLIEPIDKPVNVLRPHIKFATARVPMMAVNIEVMMPADKVMAKPLIGPVPNTNSTMAAIRVVIFASAMVEKALS